VEILPERDASEKREPSQLNACLFEPSIAPYIFHRHPSLRFGRKQDCTATGSTETALYSILQRLQPLFNSISQVDDNAPDGFNPFICRDSRTKKCFHLIFVPSNLLQFHLSPKLLQSCNFVLRSFFTHKSEDRVVVLVHFDQRAETKSFYEECVRGPSPS
jgi:hypothetical protein